MSRILLSILTILYFSIANGQTENTADQGEHFIGTWHALLSPDTIIISKEGSDFTLKSKTETIAYTYKDGQLKSSAPVASSILYNSMNGHIFWRGKEMAYADSPEPPAAAVEPLSPSQDGNEGGITDAKPRAGLVSNNFSGGLATRESVLLSYSANLLHPNRMAFLDFNFHEETPGRQDVANTIYNALMNSDRFIRVPFDSYQGHANDSIFFIINYSDVSVEVENIGRLDMYNNLINDFTARTSCKILVTDYSGKELFSSSFSQGEITGERIHFFRYPTEQDAIDQSTKKLAEKLTAFFTEKFPLITKITAIDEKSKDGRPKTVVLAGGTADGISKQQIFKIVSKNQQIGTVKVKSVTEHTAICKVLDGGYLIATRLAEGKTPRAISE